MATAAYIRCIFFHVCFSGLKCSPLCLGSLGQSCLNRSDILFHKEDLEDDGVADMASGSDEETEEPFCICWIMKEKMK